MSYSVPWWLVLVWPGLFLAGWAVTSLARWIVREVCWARRRRRWEALGRPTRPSRDLLGRGR